MGGLIVSSRRWKEDRRGNAPLVSIVIPNHNYGRFLPGCLNSIVRQSIGPECVEVLVVDDASTDGSPELARGLLPSLPFAAWRVESVPRAGRPGPVRNAGLALARGEYLFTLDPDDDLLPDFLARCLDALDTGADVAGADYLRLGEDGARVVVSLPEYDRLLLANQNILAPTALFRRCLWERGARFRRRTLYEDWDFWIQLALLGARFAHVAEPLYLHREHAGSFSETARTDDARSKAFIVAANAAFFPSWTCDWARAVLAGAPDATGRGLIPLLPEHAGRPLG